MMPSFQREQISALWPEVMPLLEMHWHEIAHYPDIPLDVDRAYYELADEHDQLRVFTVRDDGALIGYAAFFVQPGHRHYKGSRQAAQDVIFLLPAYRKSGVGRAFISWCDEQLRANHCQVSYHHIKARSDLNFGPLLESMGYELVDLVYAKRLD